MDSYLNQINSTLDKQQNKLSDDPQKLCIASDKAFELLKIKTAIKLTKTDYEASEVIPNLYLGSVGAAYNKDQLLKSGITHILTVADKLQPRYPKDF